MTTRLPPPIGRVRRSRTERLRRKTFPWSAQDRALALHFIAFVRASDPTYGPMAARDIARLVVVAHRQGTSFGIYVAHLIQADAASQGW